MLDGFGLARFLDPARLVLARSADQAETLWAMEEALRSGAAPWVIAELEKPPDLTQGRRLQLAAEAGGGAVESSAGSVVGLAVVSQGSSAKGGAAETRWRAEFAPVWGEGAATASIDATYGERSEAARWRFELVKNKRGRLGCWEAVWPVCAASPIYQALAA